MKKTNFLFTLFLCLTLLVSFASAETAAYVPGETTSALFADAFDAGYGRRRSTAHTQG